MKTTSNTDQSNLRNTLLTTAMACCALVGPGAWAGDSPAPLPVLLVIASRDFYYKEYADTRKALEEAGIAVRVAAASTERSIPHPNSGQPIGSDGGIVPDISLGDAEPKSYSAIAFVGGWGSSMYQYAYNDPNFDGVIDNFYVNSAYNGDPDLTDGKTSETKVQTNHLINEFIAADKPVAAICHGVTVLAWARVNGASPLRGRRVAVPHIGSPATYYRGQWYDDFELSQYSQVVANGAVANFVSGQYGNPNTVADDVVVDGRIITAENYDTSTAFGRTLAMEVRASANPPPQRPPGKIVAKFKRKNP